MTKIKILDAVRVAIEYDRTRKYDIPILLATGCFDILHRGHVEMLESARQSFPAHEIWVGLNSDASVRMLKGEDRPVHDFMSRAVVMAGLYCVDQVFEIDSTRVAQTIRSIRPRVWVKGSDYTLETLDQGERKAAEEVGTIIHFAPMLPGYSTTEILKRL